MGTCPVVPLHWWLYLNEIELLPKRDALLNFLGLLFLEMLEFHQPLKVVYSSALFRSDRTFLSLQLIFGLRLLKLWSLAT